MNYFSDIINYTDASASHSVFGLCWLLQMYNESDKTIKRGKTSLWAVLCHSTC